MRRLHRSEVVEVEGAKFLLVPVDDVLADRLVVEMESLKKMGLRRIKAGELVRAIILHYLATVDDLDNLVADDDSAWRLLWKL